jgi:hypothetical protein
MKEPHATLEIGCPNVLGGGHADFHIDPKKGRAICGCGEDFTENLLELKQLIDSILKGEMP